MTSSEVLVEALLEPTFWEKHCDLCQIFKSLRLYPDLLILLLVGLLDSLRGRLLSTSHLLLPWTWICIEATAD